MNIIDRRNEIALLQLELLGLKLCFCCSMAAWGSPYYRGFKFKGECAQDNLIHLGVVFG